MIAARNIFVSIIIAQTVFGKVIGELKSIVVLENTTATFTCSSGTAITPMSAHVLLHRTTDGTNNATYFPADIIDFMQPVPQYDANVTGHAETINGVTEYAFTIEVLAVIANNESEVTCYFNGNQIGPEVLYIASETLGNTDGFKTLKINSINSTTTTISWSRPWSHSINSYTITIINRSSSSWADHPIDNNVTTWNIQRDNTDDDTCPEFDIYITAYTDIGVAKSSIMRTGFSKAIKLLQVDDISIEILTKQSGNLTVQVRLVKAIEHCSSVQTILYNFTITDNDDPLNTITYGPLENSEIDIENLKRDKNYTLQVKYWEKDAQSEAMTTAKILMTTRSMNTTNCSRLERSSTDAEAKVNQLKVILSIVSAIAAAGLLVTVTIITTVIIFCNMQRKTRNRNKISDNNRNVNEEIHGDMPPLPRGRSKTLLVKSTGKSSKERRPSIVPQTMATNPLYQGSDTLYSYLPDSRDIRTLDLGRPNDTQVYAEIPLQVTVPVKETLDSPGLKTGVQLTLDKHARKDVTECNDQYIQMCSNSEQRYIHSPSTNEVKVDGRKAVSEHLHFENCNKKE